ncbi:uncharacterized protein B0H18DRAFT_846790, partial [Fomitopsis serialis]|uniref:uncharacterized protein n=1 Tax=Fomitopsis serialis TaxID=139415 RepID=UPI002008E8A6
DACPSLYTVVSGDTCPAVEATEGLTAAQLLALNPWLDSNCDLEIGEVLCVGPNSSPTSTVYTVVSGDYCAEIESDYGLTAAQLYALNPWLDSAC